MKTFMEQAKLYAIYHQKPLTRHIQMIGMPLFILACMILLGCVHVVVPGLLNISLAAIGGIILLAYYFHLNWRLALIVTPVFICLWWLGGLFSSPSPTFFTLIMFLIALTLSVLVRYAGFYIEGKYPPPADGVRQIVIAPLLLAADVLFMAGRMRTLKDAIYGGVK